MNFLKKNVPLFFTLLLLFFLNTAVASTFLQSKDQIRSKNATALLNDYYRLRTQNPTAAKMVLQVAAIRYPNDLRIQKELMYLHLMEHKDKHPLKQLKVRKKITHAVKKKKKVVNTENDLLNEYYQLEKTNPSLARMKLDSFVKEFPNNYLAQKQIGFAYLNENEKELAFDHFYAAYKLKENDYTTAAQIGFLLDSEGKKKLAFQYFQQAFETPDPVLKDEMYGALRTLSSTRYKMTPDPYFVDIYASPLYYSRFNLAIFPGWMHAGRSFGQNKQFRLYTNFLINADNRSTGATLSNAGSYIFEDDYFLYGVGGSYAPFLRIPMTIYAEVGEAYDLINQNRPPSRGDFRGGVISYFSWNKNRHYTSNPSFPFTQVGDFSTNFSYFTRYEDWINTGQLREGFNLLQYGCVSFDLYGRVVATFDSQSLYYNNFYEYGPGLLVTPNYRWPLSIRLEHRIGYYISVNSPVENPYGNKYTANLAMLEFNITF